MVGRGIEDVTVTKVDHVDIADVTAFTDDLDTVAAAENREVAGKGESSEDGDLVASYGECAGGVDFAEDADLEVEELDCHDGVLDVASGDDFVVDIFLELPTSLAGSLNRTENGEIDLAFIVNHVAKKSLH